MALLKVPKEPCYTDKCLVRAACKLKKELPWKRIYECEIYQKHRTKVIRIMEINNFFGKINEFSFAIFCMILVIVLPLGLMGLGGWKLWELIGPFIKGLFS